MQRSVIVVCLLLCHAGRARAAEPPTAPILRIETGMHTAPIKRIATDAANRYLVTGSHDKTVRVWELTTGRLLGTLRPPIGAGDEGKIYAVGMSPDGQTIACGGLTSNEAGNVESVYLFDRATGELRRRIGGLPSVVRHIAFSPDGRLLAVMVGSSGLRVFRAADGAQEASDTQYGSDNYGADFDRTGRLVTSCFDGQLRLYDRAFKLIAKEPLRGGRMPLSVSYSPDGEQIAVGFADSTKVEVRSGHDLAFIFAPDTTGVDNGELFSVTWSADGKFLFASGSWLRNGNLPMRRWSDSGRGAYTEFLTGAENITTSLLPLNDGGVAFGTANPEWGVLTANGKRTLFQPPSIANLRGLQRGGLRLADAGDVLTFCYDYGGESLARFALAARAVLAGATDNSLQPPRTSAPGLNVTDWLSEFSPKLNGTPLVLSSYESSRSLAIAPDASGFLLGTDWYLRYFDRSGKEQWKVPVPSVAWAVNIAGNNRVAAAAFGDGTIRWYRLRDGHELLAFFPHADKKRWVVWTPSGYFDCSPGGEDLIGWHVNNGKDRAADFYPASRFRSTYYRPDVISHVLEALDEQGALRLANAESGRKEQEADTLKRVPPVVRIASPEDGGIVSSTSVTLRYVIRTPSGESVKALRVLIDGRPVGAPKDLQVVSRRDEGEPGEVTVTIPERDCEVSIIAENRFAASVPAVIRLRWRGAVPPPEQFIIKPKLYVLAVGISQYQDPTLRLDFAAKDVTDFVAALMAQKGGLYRDVEAKVLTDKAATKEDILDGLQWIREQTTSKDVAMVFFSGHGDNDPSTGTYFFVPQNFNRARLLSTSLPFSDIKNAIAAIAGKALFFVDTCHSGNVLGGGKTKDVGDLNGIVNELISAENGVIVFAASTGKQKSRESAEWQNGAFTKALVEGLRGAAGVYDINKTGRITVNMLDLYVSERVKELTQGTQTPTTTKPPSVPDFPVAVKR